jgi:hypothetical protein
MAGRTTNGLSLAIPIALAQSSIPTAQEAPNPTVPVVDCPTVLEVGCPMGPVVGCLMALEVGCPMVLGED